MSSDKLCSLAEKEIMAAKLDFGGAKFGGPASKVAKAA